MNHMGTINHKICYFIVLRKQLPSLLIIAEYIFPTLCFLIYSWKWRIFLIDVGTARTRSCITSNLSARKKSKDLHMSDVTSSLWIHSQECNSQVISFKAECSHGIIRFIYLTAVDHLFISHVLELQTVLIDWLGIKENRLALCVHTLLQGTSQISIIQSIHAGHDPNYVLNLLRRLLGAEQYEWKRSRIFVQPQRENFLTV
jgi:hypothetical protein